MSAPNTVLPYISQIHVPPDVLSKRFSVYRLNQKQLTNYGYPLETSGNPGMVEITESSKFFKSQDPISQICRCGKRFSMLQHNWFVAFGGCHFHPRKRAHSGPYAGLYECCNTKSRYDGCVNSKYHVSSIRPYHDIQFKKTMNANGRMTSLCNIYALDCEMCFTTIGMEIVKVSLVGVHGSVVYDTYVKPKNTVLDYNTSFSGVSSEDLENVNTTLEDVQTILLKLINSESILVGHSLENDLMGLHIIHECIVDTSIMFPHVAGFPYKNSLKSLAYEYLGKDIQSSAKGHDSIEDARTCLELVLWKITNQVSSFELSACAQPYNCVSCLLGNYHAYPYFVHNCQGYYPVPHIIPNGYSQPFV